jgi:ubiquinone/menaquinone biosynthesis C-methylase UbiE
MAELDVSNVKLRTHVDVISEHLALAGKQVLDVGCGDGHLSRTMARQGAHVIGIEPGERMLAKARAAEPVGTETYLEGAAEALPVGDANADIVVFFNSLHHVPVAGMKQALVESRRALKDEGMLYIAEPLAHGSQFELHRPVIDETQVRAEAYRAIQASAALGFRQEHETIYGADVCLPDFESFRERSVSISPDRAAVFEAQDQELRRRFEAFGEQRPDGWHFRQYIRVNVLQPV